jgi:D-lactate dehydrogenase (cytochrome)
MSGVSNNVAGDYPDYLRDESRRTGKADSISFPKTESELISCIKLAHKQKMPVTVQGARTGIAGGAVPEGGAILNLSRMNRILGLRYDPSRNTYIVKVQPGVLLSELREAISKRQIESKGMPAGNFEALEKFRADGLFFFPPDPTETSASIGGMVACNASGARTFFYGPTRKYVEGARIVVMDGSVLDLKRGRQKASGRTFSVKTDSGRAIEGRLPGYRMPDVKNAAGYFVEDNMDMIDLFIGCEGTLGVFSEIELKLLPSPKVWTGVMAFFPSEESALHFVRQIRVKAPHPIALEFFDHCALDLLREQKKTNPAFAEIPDMPSQWHTGIYIEYHGDNEQSVEDAVMMMSETMVEAGGDADATWLVSNEREMERLKDFRHAVPEAVNLRIDEKRKKEQALTKLGTDLAVPDAALDDVMALYHRGLDGSGLQHVMFGHIGNNHLHVNIIPGTMEEYQRGKNLYLQWASAVVKMGGTVSAEHGVGKLKTALLREMYGDAGISQMRALKALFDPDNLLDRGNLFDG